MFLNAEPIVILGLPQCGTSRVAEETAREVFFPNPRPAESNEHRRLYAFNHKCLGAFGMEFASVASLPKTWRALPQASALMRELASILTEDYSTRERWFIEQPLASLLGQLYEEVFTELDLRPRFLVCVESPANIRAKESSQQLGSRLAALWLRYTLGALELARTSHYRIVSQDRILSTGEEHELVRSVLAFCETDPLDEERLAELIDRYRLWSETLAPAGLSGTQAGLAWDVAGQVRSSLVPFLPSSDWQTLEFVVDAPSNSSVNGVLYNKAARIWIRRATLQTSRSLQPARLVPGPGSSLGAYGDLLRLDGAYEPMQVNLVLPDEPGPYRLTLELLLESNEIIANETAHRLSERLHRCLAARSRSQGGAHA